MSNIDDISNMFPLQFCVNLISLFEKPGHISLYLPYLEFDKKLGKDLTGSKSEIHRFDQSTEVI